MRIAFVGNMNNYSFPLALEMRKQGVDVRFVVDSPEPLHRPECRFGWAADAYGDWIFDLAPLRIRDVLLPTAKMRRLREVVADCGGVVASSIGIGLSARLKKPTFVLTAGSDLDVMADDEQVAIQRRIPGRSAIAGNAAAWLYGRFVAVQQRGFRRAVGVDYALPGLLPHGDALLERIGVPLSRRYAFMPTDVAHLPFTPLPVNPALRILNSARLCWVQPLPPGFGILDNKRNDILVEGVALFHRRSGQPVDLRLPKKGQHVAETRALVDRLGIPHCVTWFDEMTQAEFKNEILAADIVADHFGEGVIGVGAREAMALGRPVIANGKPELVQRHLGAALPIADARTPEEVARAIEGLSSRAARERQAEEARKFADEHLSASRAASRIVALLQAG